MSSVIDEIETADHLELSDFVKARIESILLDAVATAAMNITNTITALSCRMQREITDMPLPVPGEQTESK